uniref:Protein GrpE n=1 Tax=Magnetococcus massalia (strain MO-1) TaxID=451514 RepID=A0A1S7LPN1_MAGMO|nr:Heat shock protein GrpE [Candidatus Magnetococcus massalia]
MSGQNEKDQNPEMAAEQQEEHVSESCTLPPEGDDSMAADTETTEESGEEEATEAPTVEQQLQEATALAEENHQNLLRTMAEMDNLRKRQSREMEQARKFALENFARDLLPVADNMERAMGAMESYEEGSAIGPLVEGVQMIQQELTKVFEKNGVVRVESVDQPFDPNLHQAVMQMDSDKAPGTVVQEMQAGYTLNERLLRPAMVGVAKEG